MKSIRQRKPRLRLNPDPIASFTLMCCALAGLVKNLSNCTLNLAFVTRCGAARVNQMSGKECLARSGGDRREMRTS
jgi:hypothetical protein